MKMDVGRAIASMAPALVAAPAFAAVEVSYVLKAVKSLDKSLLTYNMLIFNRLTVFPCLLKLHSLPT